MNRRLFLSSVGCLIASHAFSKEERAAPTRELFAMWGDSKGAFAVGYASGAVGLILHSKDQGKTWSQPRSNTTQSLYAVWGIGKTLYAAGANGTIVSSTDGGKTWSKQKSNTRRALYSLGGLSSKEVFAVGEAGTILYTKDSGATWEAKLSDTAQTLTSILVEKKAVYVGGVSGTLLLSTDKGATWSTQKSPSKEKLLSLQSQKGLLLVDSKQTHQSTDSGKTWSQQTLPEAAFGFFALSESHWLIPSARGKLLSSLDEGSSWSESKTGLHSALRGVCGVGKELYACSEHGGVVYSNDAGATWKIVLKETMSGGH